MPVALRFGLAFSSPSSETSRIISSSSSRFCFFLAETSTVTVLPPHSSGIRSSSVSSRLTRSGTGVRFVDLVDRHDDRHVGRPRVIDRFPGLRHHAVVGRDHEDDDVGDLRAAGAHQRERFVAGRVEEDDVLVP